MSRALPDVRIQEMAVMRQPDGLLAGTVTFAARDAVEDARLAAWHIGLSDADTYALKLYRDLFAGSTETVSAPATARLLAGNPPGRSGDFRIQYLPTDGATGLFPGCDLRLVRRAGDTSGFARASLASWREPPGDGRARGRLGGSLAPMLPDDGPFPRFGAAFAIAGSDFAFAKTQQAYGLFAWKGATYHVVDDAGTARPTVVKQAAGRMAHHGAGFSGAPSGFPIPSNVIGNVGAVCAGPNGPVAFATGGTTARVHSGVSWGGPTPLSLPGSLSNSPRDSTANIVISAAWDGSRYHLATQNPGVVYRSPGSGLGGSWEAVHAPAGVYAVAGLSRAPGGVLCVQRATQLGRFDSPVFLPSAGGSAPLDLALAGALPGTVGAEHLLFDFDGEFSASDPPATAGPLPVFGVLGSGSAPATAPGARANMAWQPFQIEGPGARARTRALDDTLTVQFIAPEQVQLVARDGMTEPVTYAWAEAD